MFFQGQIRCLDLLVKSLNYVLSQYFDIYFYETLINIKDLQKTPSILMTGLFSSLKLKTYMVFLRLMSREALSRT